MITNFPCPVCQTTDWKPVQNFVFDIRDQTTKIPAYRHYWQRLQRYFDLLWFNAPYPHTVTVPPLNVAQRLRRRALFEYWFPGTKTVTLTSVLCLGCGFMTYTPRPTQADLRAKYGFLSQERTTQDVSSARNDLERAQRVYDVVSPHFSASSAPLMLLDYGGGDGRLMQPFLQHGHRCFLVDYASGTRHGVIKLGDELDAVPSDMLFDVIICSHVLEHLANPLDTVQELWSRMKPDGVLYAEVPDEIWDGIRIEYDPVTHVNFFTRHSLNRLFLNAGYTILASLQMTSSYGQARKPVIWLLAQQCNEEAAVEMPPDVSPEKSLHPGRTRSLRRLWQQYAPVRECFRCTRRASL